MHVFYYPPSLFPLGAVQVGRLEHQQSFWILKYPQERQTDWFDYSVELGLW